MKKIVKITKEFADKSSEKSGIDISEFVGKVVKRVDVFNNSEDNGDIIQIPEDQYVIGEMSSITPDADGDVILPSAFDLTRYKTNPVVLDNHNYNKPIAFCEEFIVNPTNILAKVKFATTEEAQNVYQLYKEKIMRGFSVGFIPILEYPKGSREFQTILDSLKKQYPNIFTNEVALKVDNIIAKAELIEISCVALPNNKDALAIVVKKLDDVVIAPTVETPVIEENVKTEVKFKRLGNENDIKYKRVGNIYDEEIQNNYLKMGGF